MSASFAEFVVAHERRLRSSLTATLGPGVGREAAADALAATWVGWDEVSDTEDPTPRLFAIGAGRGPRKPRRGRSAFPTLPATRDPKVNEALARELASLDMLERGSLLLVDAYGWQIEAVAQVLEQPEDSVRAIRDRAFGELDRLMKANVGGDEPIDTTGAIVSYVSIMERDQQRITPDEVLARVENVRVSGHDARSGATSSRTRNLTIVVVAGAAFLLVVASPIIFGRWTEPTKGEAADRSQTTSEARPQVDTTLPPAIGTEVSTDTAFGTWTWTKSELPANTQMIWYDDSFWWIDSPPAWEIEGQSPASGTSVVSIWASDDGVTFERQPLPGEMQGLILYLRGGDPTGRAKDRLLIVGQDDPNSRDYRMWQWESGSWVERPFDLRGTASEALGASGYRAEGFTTTVWADETAISGSIAVAFGGVQFDSPIDTKMDSSSWEESTNTSDGGTVHVLVGEYPDETRFDVEFVRTGARIDYEFWEREKSDRVLAEIASITAPDEASAIAMMRGGGALSPGAMLFWRSDDGGSTFDVVPDPFDTMTIGDGYGWVGPTSVRSRDGRFIAYGRIPPDAAAAVGDQGTYRGSSIGAVAVSDDGLTWEVTPIPDLPDPDFPYEFGGKVLWGNQTGVWVSDDGITGEIVPLSGENWGVSVTDGFAIRQGPRDLLVTLDGRRWDSVPYPERGRDGYWTYSAGDVVVFASSAGETTWIGTFER